MAKKVIRVRYSAQTLCFKPRPIVRKLVVAAAKDQGETVSTVINDTLERYTPRV